MRKVVLIFLIDELGALLYFIFPLQLIYGKHAKYDGDIQ